MNVQQIDERLLTLHQLVGMADEEARQDYLHRLTVSWIHHDSALEGVVYTIPELIAALANEEPPETTLVPTYDEIRQHKAAIDVIREHAAKKRFTVSLDVVKRIYMILAPEECEGKTPPKYRKDMPIHRLYFHEISTPDKISYRMRQLMQWANSAETRRATHTIRLASRVHFEMMQIYPFPKHSGKVARLIMNMILLHGGYPPAVIHETERQRYYDALKSSDTALSVLVTEGLVASVESGIRYFEVDGNARAEGVRLRSA